MDEIHLTNLREHPTSTHIKLDLEFLSRLLINASKSDCLWKDRDFISHIGGKYNEKAGRYTAINNWIYGHTSVPFRKLDIILGLSSYSSIEVEKHIISIKCGQKKGEIFPKFPLPIDQKLGSIVGHIRGDGSIDKRYLQPFYTNSNIDLIREFHDNIQDIFGIQPRIWIQNSGDFKRKSKWLYRVSSLMDIKRPYQIGIFCPKICGIILHAIFGPFAIGSHKLISEQILTCNPNFKRGLIRAFFDDESSVDVKSYTQRAFQEFEINSNPVRHYTKRDKMRYYFNITGKENFNRFYEQIGYTSIKKRNRLFLLSQPN
jgi:hypothetical protein